ncbi:MAG TPA: TMEM175 family protein [Ktedonobacteraceae bacterium]
MEEKETNRLEAFSDGVFAVAITLLVLSIKVPGLDLPAGKFLKDSDLWQAMAAEWPMLIAYIISFLTIGIIWMNHHRLFIYIKRVNTLLIVLNLLLLLIIVFIPVPTALLAEYITHPEQRVAALFYCGTFFFLAFFFNLLWRYASYHHQLLGRHVDTRIVAAISRQYMFGPILYLAIFGIAWISPSVSIALTFVLALFFTLPGQTLRVLTKKDAQPNLAERQETR